MDNLSEIMTSIESDIDTLPEHKKEKVYGLISQIQSEINLNQLEFNTLISETTIKYTNNLFKIEEHFKNNLDYKIKTLIIKLKMLIKEIKGIKHRNSWRQDFNEKNNKFKEIYHKLLSEIFIYKKANLQTIVKNYLENFKEDLTMRQIRIVDKFDEKVEKCKTLDGLDELDMEINNYINENYEIEKVGGNEIEIVSNDKFKESDEIELFDSKEYISNFIATYEHIIDKKILQNLNNQMHYDNIQPELIQELENYEKYLKTQKDNKRSKNVLKEIFFGK